MTGQCFALRNRVYYIIKFRMIVLISIKKLIILTTILQIASLGLRILKKKLHILRNLL